MNQRAGGLHVLYIYLASITKRHITIEWIIERAGPVGESPCNHIWKCHGHVCCCSAASDLPAMVIVVALEELWRLHHMLLRMRYRERYCCCCCCFFRPPLWLRRGTRRIQIGTKNTSGGGLARRAAKAIAQVLHVLKRHSQILTYQLVPRASVRRWSENAALDL